MHIGTVGSRCDLSIFRSISDHAQAVRWPPPPPSPKPKPNMNTNRNDSTMLGAPCSPPTVANGNRSSSTVRYGQCISAAVISKGDPFFFILVHILKPTGHVTHQLFNIQQLYALPTLYLCVLYLSERNYKDIHTRIALTS